MSARTEQSAVLRWSPPVLAVFGLALIGLAFAPWGTGAQGVRPAVSGLGKVTVPGATADDVAFLQDHTDRPAVMTLILGALVVVAAALAWWRAELRLAGAIVAGVAGIVAAVWAILALSDPEQKLFDAKVNRALDAGSSVLDPGWGLIASLVAAVVCVAAASALAVGTRRSGPGAEPARPRPEV